MSDHYDPRHDPSTCWVCRHTRRLESGLTPCTCKQDHRGDCSNPRPVEIPGQMDLFS